ncbi:uncharacterized protein N7518_002968 [Penicillium psychrosexuale]|uniref:uncharacterized protein n=1 Tax=Penicillium psychrosexuale TaxID=1002107 RepID=UPI002545BD7F|nr:uncharacterized protein N7518_002968 [Penicillium psychrosexuale]KAJ5800900.1 hypothetical protein N7518_002968 [Penicillium psychrosexuale]
MGNGRGRNKGRGRGKKRSHIHSLKENTVATTVATKLENKPEGEISDKHHCLSKRPKHVRTSRCLRLGHVVQCPIHSDSFPLRLSECVKCNNADRRQVQQEHKDRKK